MGSWITCVCGSSIHTNLFAGAPVYQLIWDSDYDAVEDPVDRERLEDLFFKKGIPVYRCSACGRLAVEWEGNTAPVFYLPEKPGTVQAPAGEPNDDQRLKELEAMAEAEYTAMYESRSPSGAYARAKDAFGDAIALARQQGRHDDVTRLEKRLQNVREVFRSQFS